MIVAAFGALLAAFGVGIAIGAPLLALDMERQAVAKRDAAEATRVIAEQDFTIEAYRALTSTDGLVAASR
jgi:hypothetical protein